MHCVFIRLPHAKAADTRSFELSITTFLEWHCNFRAVERLLDSESRYFHGGGLGVYIPLYDLTGRTKNPQLLDGS